MPVADDLELDILHNYSGIPDETLKPFLEQLGPDVGEAGTYFYLWYQPGSERFLEGLDENLPDLEKLEDEYVSGVSGKIKGDEAIPARAFLWAHLAQYLRGNEDLRDKTPLEIREGLHDFYPTESMSPRLSRMFSKDLPYQSLVDEAVSCIEEPQADHLVVVDYRGKNYSFSLSKAQAYAGPERPTCRKSKNFIHDGEGEAFSLSCEHEINSYFYAGKTKKVSHIEGLKYEGGPAHGPPLTFIFYGYAPGYWRHREGGIVLSLPPGAEAQHVVFEAKTKSETS